MARIGYNLVLLLLLPFIAPRLALRARRQPEYLEHVGERFGRYRQQVMRPVIWLHAVSVGETRAAQPLVARLLERYPDHQLLMTHMTPTGRHTSEQLFGDRLQRCYLPYDYPWAVRRFLAHFAPRLGIILETELWPNLISACRARGLPLLLVNARMSERSARRYARLPRLTREVLTSFAAVAAQTEGDAQRLRRLGAGDVQVFGNMKFDLLPPAPQIDAGRALRRMIGERAVVLFASTRESEEALIIDALCQRLRSTPDSRSTNGADLLTGALLIVVPRHPQRFAEVARLIEARGLTLQRRSDHDAIAPQTQVLLGDTMGEMYAYYAASDLAFIGGSLLPLGGQNLIEACAVGVAVLIGPHTFNFAEATEQALAAGAARRVSDAQQLMKAAAELLRDAEARLRMGRAGEEFAARHRGATGKTMECVARHLGSSTPAAPSGHPALDTV